METGKPINYYVRALHRNIGFFIAGLVIIYAVSGITLIFRDTNFLKYEKQMKTTLPAETKLSELAGALKLKEINIIESKDSIVYFQGGSFNLLTGEAQYTVKTLVFPLNKLTILHKTPSKNPFHWITLAIGILMLFMAISSFWMFKSHTKQYRKGMVTVLAGIVFAVILLFFVK